MRTKIRGGLILVFLVSLIVAFYAAIAVARITNYIEQMEILTRATNQANDMVMAHHIWISRITESFIFDTDFPGGLNPATCVWGQWRYSDQIYIIDDPTIMELIRSIDHPHAELHIQGAEALRLRAEGRYDEAFALLQNVVLPYGEISTANITALYNRYHELWSDVHGNLQLVGREVLRTIIIIFALTFVVLLALSYLIPKSILKPVNQLVAIVKDVSNGNMNINQNPILVNDEIGELTQYIYILTSTVKNIVDDFAKTYHEYMDIGNMQYQINESKYNNSFKETTRLINKLLSRMTEDMDYLRDQLILLSGGDFSVQMDTTAWPGDWKAIPKTVNQLLSSLKSVGIEINAMTEAIANKGDVSFQIDTNEYNGDWQKIMTGLNDVAKAVDVPLEIILQTLEEMRQGHFNLSEIDARLITRGLDVNVESYKGVFKAIIVSINDTLEEIEDYISEITKDLVAIAQGNLNTEVVRHFAGDFAPIKDSLNNISITMHKTISEISTVADQVLMGANQISISATDLSSGAQEQASSVEELTATIDLINQQTRQNADNAYTANELSQKSATNAKEGNETMKQTVNAMAQIKESSGNISKIIKTIQDIAFQTNLLALNASVEAARAGEHGRGFAVVADEVRILAGRSEEAANETTTLIQDSIKRVETGSSIAETTSKSLDDIVTSSSEVSEVIDSISAASQGQAEAIGQISDGLAQISKVIQNNSAVSEETAAAAEELNSQSEVLRQLVSFFKL